MRLEEKREFTFEVTFLLLYPVALPLLKLFNLSLVLAPQFFVLLHLLSVLYDHG